MGTRNTARVPSGSFLGGSGVEEHTIMRTLLGLWFVAGGVDGLSVCGLRLWLGNMLLMPEL